LVPPFVLLAGGVALWWHVRRRSRGESDVASGPLTADEEARLKSLIASDAPAEGS